MNTTEIDKLAGRLYSRYCIAVGGVTFNGDLLPNWEELSVDLAKEKQVNAWKAVAEMMLKNSSETSTCYQPTPQEIKARRLEQQVYEEKELWTRVVTGVAASVGCTTKQLPVEWADHIVEEFSNRFHK